MRQTLQPVTPHLPPTGPFAQALTHAIATTGASPAAVAEALGLKSDDTVRKWMKGDRRPEPGHVFAVEAALGLTPGDLSRHLGYLPATATPSVLAAIGADPLLDDRSRAGLESAYRAMVSDD